MPKSKVRSWSRMSSRDKKALIAEKFFNWSNFHFVEVSTKNLRAYVGLNPKTNQYDRPPNYFLTPKYLVPIVQEQIERGVSFGVVKRGQFYTVAIGNHRASSKGLYDALGLALLKWRGVEIDD